MAASGVDDDETLRLLSSVERTLTSRIDDALRAHGAGIDQWRILSLLADRGGQPMNVVAEHAMMLAPKLSKLVDKMVADNLILRRPDLEDRRRVRIAATERGRKALAEWDRAVAAVQEDLRAALGEDVEKLTALLRRAHAGLARGGVPVED
ncbi:DNA-binding transcriptional regulator, MarR family [Pseudonocardia thermophila]|uniref:DNA-binding transcriptional regulator, MarR family n=1 Tax=Pseudonocardia thermophila TaxID=1848 RepID=A0A1M6UJL8_PSETH|nr:MarR family transcriptional regulator [Pseudonocardia thermophila]SHK69343.1 DNA-binding transcriptional regulator, MarR family [Pseudonocardia thermophila]